MVRGRRNEAGSEKTRSPPGILNLVDAGNDAVRPVSPDGSVKTLKKNMAAGGLRCDHVVILETRPIPARVSRFAVQPGGSSRCATDRCHS